MIDQHTPQDLNYLRTLSSDFLRDLKERIALSQKELEAYEASVIQVLEERLYADHPLFGKDDVGDDPRKGTTASDFRPMKLLRSLAAQVKGV